MAKHLLNLEQMLVLKDKNLLIYNTTFMHVKFEDMDKWIVKSTSELQIIGVSHKRIPAFTLIDIIDMLSTNIFVDSKRYTLQIDFFYNTIGYKHGDISLVQYTDEEIIDAAYHLLLWCSDNKYVITD